MSSVAKTKKSYKNSIAKNVAIEYIANNPKLQNKQLATALKVSEETLIKWKMNPKFIDAVYDRFMEIAGIELPSIVQSMIREAKEGNVRAAELVLKHFGKLQDQLVIKVESPFMQHLKVHDTDIEEIEVEDEDKAKMIASSIEIPQPVPLPPRNPDKANTNKVIREENISEHYAKLKEKQKTSAARRAKWRRRAEKVNVAPLSTGRPSKTQYEVWKQKIINAEAKLNGSLDARGKKVQ